MVLVGIDYALMAGYFLLILLVAWWTSRKASDESFLIADRDVGVLGTMATINASKTGSILLIFVAMLYTKGLAAIWYFFGVAAGYLVFTPFALKLRHYHGKQHYTLAHYFFDNYDSLTAKYASALNIFVALCTLMLNLMASSKVLSFFTGISFELATLIVSVFVLAYLLMGGFKAVVTTDIVQYAAMVLAFVIFAITLTSGVTIPAGELNVMNAAFGEIIAFFLLGILYPFAMPELWQRVYSSRTSKTFVWGVLLSVAIYIGLGLLLSVVGLAIKTQFPGADPDTALIFGFSELLPAGLAGLGVIVFFAAFMSSIDTYAYTSASCFVQDFFRELDKRETVRRIRWSIVFSVVVMSLVGILVKNLVIGAYMFAGYVIILSIPIICTWIKPSIKSKTLQIALGAATLLLTAGVIYGLASGTLDSWILLVAIAASLFGLLIGAVFSWLS